MARAIPLKCNPTCIRAVERADDLGRFEESEDRAGVVPVLLHQGGEDEQLSHSVTESLAFEQRQLLRQPLDDAGPQSSRGLDRRLLHQRMHGQPLAGTPTRAAASGA